MSLEYEPSSEPLHISKVYNVTRHDLQVRGVVVTEAGSYLRLIDSCITQLEAHGPSRTCNESKEEEEKSR